MEIYKFGGASIKDAPSIRRIAEILEKSGPDRLLIVVSAIGKTTNLLEKLLDKALQSQPDAADLEELSIHHTSIIKELFGPNNRTVLFLVQKMMASLEDGLKRVHKRKRLGQSYARIVCHGELMASTIISNYLNHCGFQNQWIDARDWVRTDSRFPEATIDWEYTRKKIRSSLPRMLDRKPLITQGFIGKDKNGKTTTLGREGSDFTAAIFGACLGASKVSVWKDVDGIRNADPRFYSPTVKHSRLSYQEAAEMSYYGAKVIHPKTIKPLALAGIPLHVRSFNDVRKTGTIIDKRIHSKLLPSVIFKLSQCLISFKVRDFTFINETSLSGVFHRLDRLGIKINLMQNSAITLSICVDDTPPRIEALIESLRKDFEILYNRNLCLITVKNYDQVTVDKIYSKNRILLEQRSRVNFQIVVPEEDIQLPIEGG